MKLQDFFKKLFSQEAVEGYELGCVEVHIRVGDDNSLVVSCEDNSNATITIVPKETENK